MGSFYKCLSILRKTRTSKTWARMEKFRSDPIVEADAAGTRPRLQEIPGLVPRLTQPIPGCAFAPRCGFATGRCAVEPPPLIDAGAGHTVACWEVERVRASAP